MMNAGLNVYNSVDNQVKIEDADNHRLIQLLMGGALERLGKAVVSIKSNNIEKKSQYIGSCVAIIVALKDSLDMEQGGEIAQNLNDLYVYMVEKCTQANLENDIQYLEEVIKLMTEIKSGWDGIREESLKIMQEQKS